LRFAHEADGFLGRRGAVRHACENYRVTERHACRLLGQWRGTQRYEGIGRADEDALTGAIIALASEYGRYVYRRITVKLREAESVRANIERARASGRRRFDSGAADRSLVMEQREDQIPDPFEKKRTLKTAKFSGESYRFRRNKKGRLDAQISGISHPKRVLTDQDVFPVRLVCTGLAGDPWRIASWQEHRYRGDIQ
jgi:hypothetical protein